MLSLISKETIKEKISESVKKELSNLMKSMNLILSKPGLDETSTSFRNRIREPGLFNQGSFRTITIQQSPLVRGVVGKLKNKDKPSDPTLLQTLIFPKSAGWTRSKVQDWLKSHSPIQEKDYNG